MASPDLTGMVWRKSSRSGNMANCVEVGSWRKSSRSGDTADCVEVCAMPDVVGVRDSKNPTGPVLVVDPARWMVFAIDVKSGSYDL